jgi:hypothetical protein
MGQDPNAQLQQQAAGGNPLLPNSKLSPGGLPIPPGRFGTPGTPPELASVPAPPMNDPYMGTPTTPATHLPPEAGQFGGGGVQPPAPSPYAPPPAPFAPPPVPPPQPPPAEPMGGGAGGLGGVAPAGGGAAPYQKPGGSLAAQQLGLGIYKKTPQGTTNWGKVSPGGLPPRQ